MPVGENHSRPLFAILPIPARMNSTFAGYRKHKKILPRVLPMPPDDQSPSDDALIAQVRSGDRQALAQFLSARQPQLMAFIDRRLGAALRRKIEVDDLYQEVSAEAVR